MKQIYSALAVLLTGAILSAQADNGWGIFGSYWNSSDAGDTAGIGTSLSFELMPGASLDFRYTYFDGFSTSDGGVNVETQVTPVELGFQFHSSDDKPLQFMAGLGAGFYKIKAETTGGGQVLGNPDIDDEWGGYVMGGLEYTVSRNVEEIQATRFTLFAELMYRYVQAEKVNGSSGATFLIDDGDLGGLGVNAGVKLRW